MHCFGCDTDSEGESLTCEVCGKPLATDADRYFKAGMEALAAGDVNRSISFLRDCVKLEPNHLSGRYNLGLALCLVGACDEATEQYRAVIEQQPDFPGIYTALGQAAFGSYLSHLEHAESNRYAMIELLMRAIEQDPEDVDAYFSLGNAYIAIGTADKALPWLKCAMKLHPDSAAIYFVVAKAFKMLERYPEATLMARRSVELSDPNDPFLEDVQNLLSELQAAALAS